MRLNPQPADSQQQSSDPGRILIVDDERSVLEFYALQLRDEFPLDTAQGGEQGLAAIAAHVPYAVVVTDRNMPGMSGSEFLRRVQELSPDTVRLMLTADSQQAAAVEAVNQGQVFRFLNKPCPASELAKAIHAALQQYFLRRNEKDLLSSTLNSCVQLMVEMLSLANPLAFGRALRIKRIVQSLCTRLGVQDAWEITTAALLSHTGCISLPDSVLHKVQRGEQLSAHDDRLYQSHPETGHDLIARIPRLSRIADIIAMQQSARLPRIEREEPFQTPRQRAGFLKIAVDYDLLIKQGHKPEHAIRQLMTDEHLYDARLLEALKETIEHEQNCQVCGVSFGELQTGMVLQSDIVDERGSVLVTKGNELTASLLDRLRRQREDGRTILEPIQVQMEPQDTNHDPVAVEIPSLPMACGTH